MPRKQRFKPSRKPKLDVPNEASTIERHPGQTGSTHDNAGARDSPHVRDEGSSTEGEIDQSSR
jgi:hypothetical protein